MLSVVFGNVRVAVLDTRDKGRWSVLMKTLWINIGTIDGEMMLSQFWRRTAAVCDLFALQHLVTCASSHKVPELLRVSFRCSREFLKGVCCTKDPGVNSRDCRGRTKNARVWRVTSWIWGRRWSSGKTKSHNASNQNLNYFKSYF